MRGAQTRQHEVINLPKRERILGPLCQEGMLFSFTHVSSPFSVRDLWEFLQI